MDKPVGIVVLEGADGTGKTTLARRLVEDHGAFYIHKRLHADMWRHHTAALRLAVRYSATRLVVIDRLWISECIYGRTFRQASAYPFTARCVDRTLWRFGALTVICSPPLDWTITNFKQLKKTRKEMFTSMEEVAQRYHHLWYGGSRSLHPEPDYVEQLTISGGLAFMRPDFALYDVSSPADREDEGRAYVEGVLLPRLAELRRHRREKELDPAFHNLAGAIGPDCSLLVGDELGNPDSPVRWPFYANVGSPRYLAKTLHQLGVDETRIALANAHDPGFGYVLNLAATRVKRIVALGREAERTLEKHKPHKPIIHVRHPQHARRFTHHDDSYRQELERALCAPSN